MNNKEEILKDFIGNDLLKFIFDTFENEDIKNFAIEIVSNFPSYIWEVGASSTGKFHPSYTLGEYGLIKHQIATCKFINFFFELDQYKNRFNSRQRDCLRTAALVHDGRKSGLQEDYEKSKYTKFNHPLLMAKEIMSYKDKDIIPNEEIIYIAKAIASHMGQWNTDKKSELALPKPDNEAQELVHLADYLASRKCLNMDFSECNMLYEENKSNTSSSNKMPMKDDFHRNEVSLDTYKMPFGKHEGKLITEIPKDYLQWLSKQDLKEPLKSLLDQMKKEDKNE